VAAAVETLSFRDEPTDRGDLTDRVRVPDYLRAWWTELGINSVTANATQVVWRVRGPRCARRFQAAVHSAVARHEVLTRRVVRYDDAFYLERVARYEIASYSDDVKIDELVWAPFAEGAAAFRPFVVETSEREAVCGFVIHHRVVDYYGAQVLAREIRDEILGEGAPPADTDGLRPQYSNFLRGMADWVTGAEARRRLDYWRQSMRGSPETCLPAAASIDPAVIGPLQYLDFELSPTLRAKLASVARSCRATLALITMAAHHIALAAELSQEDIAAKVIVSGRDAPALLNIVGYTADCFPLRASVDPKASFPAFLRQIQETFVRGCRNRVKWELVEEEMTRAGASAIIPTFNFIPGVEGPRAPDDTASQLSVEPMEAGRAPERGSAAFNMSHSLGLFDSGRLVYAHLKYMPMRQDRRAAEAFLERFMRCLTAIAHHPFVPVERIATLN
jgi:hypothetical protein